MESEGGGKESVWWFVSMHLCAYLCHCVWLREREGGGGGVGEGKGKLEWWWFVNHVPVSDSVQVISFIGPVLPFNQCIINSRWTESPCVQDVSRRL